MKMCCNVCNKYRKFKNHKISYIFKKTLDFSTVYSECVLKEIFKEEDSIKILKIVGFITNIEEYQELCDHV